MEESLKIPVRDRSGDFPYFRRIWNTVVVALLAAAFVPLIVIGGGMYSYLTAVIKEKTVATLRVEALDLKNAVDRFLAERTLDLKLISENIGLQGLRDPLTLQSVFASLQRELPVYTDLGVIDLQGRHLAYVGPYDLLSKNYRGAQWFDIARSRGVYISDVFLGHRNAPHFIIAVKQDAGAGAWFLRATIDTEYFQRMISAIAEKNDADAYFVNQRGIYQTRPRSAGQLMAQSPYSNLEPFEGVVFQETDDHLLMTVWLEKVSWLCAVRMDRKQAFAALRHTRVIGIWVFVLASIPIAMTVLLTTNHLVTRLEANRRSIRFLDRQLRQSNRLATAMELALGFFRNIKEAFTNIDAVAMGIQDLGRGEVETEITGKTTQIRSEAARSLASIDRFLRFTRNADPIIKPLNINKVLDELIEILDKELRFKNIRVVRDYENSLPAARSDPSALHQVFQNLILNAVAAIQTDGEITLKTRRQSDTVTITVADTGPGIAPEHREKIFAPLFTTKPGGTGLGLPICADILERLGGRIRAQNRPQGGACFVVRLPIQFNRPAASDT